MRRDRPTSTPRRRRRAARAWAAAAAALLASAVAVAATGGAGAAALSVNFDVRSITVLDESACTSDAATVIGTITPGDSRMTADDCTVTFGSTNDTARLRIHQSDGEGTAMMAPPTGITTSAVDRNRSIDMVDASTGWLAGEGGRIEKTTNGGVSWTAQTTGTGVFLRNIDAWDTSVAYAGGNDILLSTTDGGATAWNTQPAGGNNVVAVSAISGTVAWAATADAFFRTSNSGGTWTEMPHGEAEYVNAMVGLSSSTAVALSWGDAIRTADTGATFQRYAACSFAPNDMAAFDASTLVGVGTFGRTCRSTDGGFNWTQVDVGTTEMLLGIDARPTGVAVAVGERGTFFRSTDFGLTWTDVGSHVDGTALWDVGHIDDSTMVIATGGRGVMTSNDAGVTRTDTDVPATAWMSVDLVRGDTGWRVGGRGEVERTVDGGDSWSAQASGVSTALLGISAWGPTDAVAVGAGGEATWTDDGGVTWNAVATGSAAVLRAVATADPGIAVAVGHGGEIWRSTDNGQTWASVASGTAVDLLDVEAHGDGMWASGDAGVTLRSGDAGATWTVAPTLVDATFPGNGITVASDQEAWVTSNDDVAHTTDGGTTWDVVDGPISHLYDVVSAGPRDLVALGDYARMIASHDGGATWSAVPGSGRTAYRLASRGPDQVLGVGDSNVKLELTPGASYPDYDAGVTDWDDGAGFFGVCLRAIANATTSWTAEASCVADDDVTGHWRGVPADAATPASELADVASSVSNGRVDLRFASRVPAAQDPGTYRAGITFEVVAPIA